MYNERKVLIMQFKKSSGAWEDVTNQIEHYSRQSNSFVVKYYNNSTEYNVSFNSLALFSTPSIIPIDGKIVRICGNATKSIDSVLRFGDWYKVYFTSGFSEVYKKTEISIARDLMNSDKCKAIISYLKEIASLLSVDDGKDFLHKQLEKLTIPENTILAKMLEGRLGKTKHTGPILTLFSTNESQNNAVKTALSNDISVIQGPPGTGKTQTILNIVANCVSQGQSVAVLSGNNEAIENVYEKLRQDGYDYMNAVLGNRDNIDAFFTSDHVLPPVKKTGDSNTLTSELSKTQDLLGKCLRAKVDAARLEQLTCDYSIEKQINDAEYAITKHTVPSSLSRKKYTSRKLLELASLLEVLPAIKITNFFNRARLLFRFGILRVSELVANSQDVIDYLKNRYYGQKIVELRAEHAKKIAFLTDNKADVIAKRQNTLSKALFDARMRKKYQALSNQAFTVDGYKRVFADFTKRYPVVYSTTHAIRSCSGDSHVYDCVIIDEASQVDLVTAMIAFSCAKRIVLVGDEKQLTHVINAQIAKTMDNIFAKYSLPDYLNYTKNNVLQFVNTAFPSIPSTLLNEHYRCDPQIIGFCNKRFYNGQLVLHTTHEKGNGVTIIKHGSHLCRDRTNEREADIIDKEILPNIDGDDIGIIAPYRRQVNLLSSKLDGKKCTIDTVHKFQGKERDHIILSTVSNKVQFYEDDERIDFLNNPNLINVALSRAKKRLYILTSEELVNQDGTIIKDLSKYYEYYCDDTKIIKTSVYSVFDLMYDDYAPILEEMKKSIIRVSDFESENIIATVLKEICDSGKFGALSFRFNYPLKYVIKGNTLTDEEDIKFVNNINTHCDFIVYSTLNKEIILEIEVDGSQHNEAQQSARDKRKDRLLKSAGIKQLRLSTTTIECREKIIEQLINK